MKRETSETNPPSEIPVPNAERDWAFIGGGIAITAAAIFLRFYDLALKPFHHDEGVNGFFLTSLFREGTYKYDPANYHGPTLYYISLAVAKVFGLETIPVRASMAIFGVAMVVMALFLRRYLGRIGSLAAALFLALSPGMVYISRYFIHEIFFVFLSFAIVMSVVNFLERRRAGIFAIGTAGILLLVCFLPSTLNFANFLAGPNTTALWLYRAGFFIAEVVLCVVVLRMLLSWNDGRPVYLLLASAFTALFFSTKETAFITIGTLAIACGCVWIWRRIYKPRGADDANDLPDDDHLSWSNLREGIGTGTDRLLLAVAAAVAFIYLGILFFSSFFTYPEGVKAAFEAYAIWTKTGSKDHTQNGFWAYIEWGFETEAPIFLLAALGTAIAFFRARHRFAMFAGLWAFGLLAAYTLIPYKTPWLAIGFILPMCLVAGYGINALAVSKNASLRILAGLFAAAAIAVLSYQTYIVNFVKYDDESAVYVYAHTNRDFLRLVSDIELYAEKSGKGRDARIEIVSPDYWPLVWYLKDYKQALFHGTLVDAADSDIVLAKKDDQDTEVIRRYSARFKYVGIYALRPGVDLVLLVRKDVVGGAGEELYKLSK